MNTTNSKRSLVLYGNIVEVWRMIRTQKGGDDACNFMELLISYATEDKEPPKDLPFEINLAFVSLRPLLDSMKAKFSACVENGKKGGRPPKAKPTTEHTTSTEYVPTETETEVITNPNKESEYFAKIESSGYLQELANHFQSTINLVLSFYGRFKQECTMKGKTHTTFEDCKGHLYNWLSKQNISDIGTGCNTMAERKKRDIVWAEYARQKLSQKDSESNGLPDGL